MSNKFNTNINSRIVEMQAAYLFNRMTKQLGTAYTKEQVSVLVQETIRRYYVNLGRPLTIKRYMDEGHLPFIEDYAQTMEEVVEDTTILFGEIERVGNTLVSHFNYAQSERLRIENRIHALAGLTNDLNLIANETSSDSMYIKDSFVDQNSVEPSMVMGSLAQISTREGIVTLGRSSTVNRSLNASIKLLQGDGELGTQHIIKRTSTTTTDQTDTTAEYIFKQTPNNDVASVLDGRPDTIFEYQMVNVDQSKIVDVAMGYDFAWVKGTQSNDRLRLRLIIELKESADVNWININPYHPTGSTGKVVVYSIRTSEDGFDYKGLYTDGEYIINAEINTTPQTYRQDEVFDGSNDFNASKFAGQGVWSFGTRKAKYVEFVFDQIESYKELFGHTYYERITTSIDSTTGAQKESSVRVPESKVPESIVNGETGKYLIGQNEYIRKAIEVFDGWRYAIGIRDISIMSYQFIEKSELVTKKFALDKPIKEVMLYANEKIPEAFLQDLKKANEWIQYYVSFDDVNWTRISPMHQMPMSGETFPPKIIELNGASVDLESSFQLYKKYMTITPAPSSVRLKIILQRPTSIINAPSFTPILEDYSLRIVFKEGSL